LKHTVYSLSLILLLGIASPSLQAVSPRQCNRKLTDRALACTETLVSMRSIQTAVEAYAVKNSRYPAAKSMSELRDLVQPAFIKVTPLTDAWGTEFRYLPSADGKSYRIVSAGSDRAFDEASWGTSGLLESSKEDAVVSSGPGEREWVIQE
jgi:hypothetical protein